eukprot:1053723-Rhodomonas_salina.2
MDQGLHPFDVAEGLLHLLVPKRQKISSLSVQPTCKKTKLVEDRLVLAPCGTKTAIQRSADVLSKTAQHTEINGRTWL